VSRAESCSNITRCVAPVETGSAAAEDGGSDEGNENEGKIKHGRLSPMFSEMMMEKVTTINEKDGLDEFKQ
jgi:hypothetical protein